MSPGHCRSPGRYSTTMEQFLKRSNGHPIRRPTRSPPRHAIHPTNSLWSVTCTLLERCGYRRSRRPDSVTESILISGGDPLETRHGIREIRLARNSAAAVSPGWSEFDALYQGNDAWRNRDLHRDDQPPLYVCAGRARSALDDTRSAYSVECAGLRPARRVSSSSTISACRFRSRR